MPDYSRSGDDAVRLVLRGGEASLAFAAFIYKQDRERKPLALDEMLVLNCLQYQRRIDAPGAGALIQKGEHQGRAVLERLVERGLIEARGESRGHAYHLSPGLYRELGAPSGHVRTHGFDPIRQEAMVLQDVKAHGRITRREAADLCGLGSDQASRLLRRMVKNGKLRLYGKALNFLYALQKVEPMRAHRL